MLPTKEQKREKAFNMVFNIVTIKTAATVYSIANIFSFGTNKVLENFDAIAESDKDRVKEFTALGEEMPEGLMKAISKIRPKIKDIVFDKPDYIDKFIDTEIYRQGIKMAKRAERFGLPDITTELNDKQIGLWMQVFMSSKNKVKNIADPMSDWVTKTKDYLDISFDPKAWI